MRFSLLVIVLFYSLTVFSQTIPYATQQPKWVFPVYAKDANGKMDTIYLGYHPGTSDVVGAETQFGEIWHPGVPDFSLSTYYLSFPTDSIIKVHIRDTLFYGYYLPYWDITLSNVVLPITFKWDVSLLRSDSIPFPDQDPLPRAQINIERPVGSYLVDEPGTTCGGFSPTIIVSDTIDTSLCYCHVKDSLKLLHPFGDTSPQTFTLNFIIVPWEGHEPGIGIKEYNNPKFTVFPNPSIDRIVIHGLKKSNNYNVVIYNTLLNVCERIPIYNEGDIIDVSFLDPGVYFIYLMDNYSKLNTIVKIIKQ